MKRRLLNILAELSLGLCFASVGLWVRSYWAQDVLFLGKRIPAASLVLSDGTVLAGVELEHIDG